MVQLAGRSPYEDGPNRNTTETWDAGIVVINRYDWGSWDGRELPSNEEQEEEGGIFEGGRHVAVGMYWTRRL